MSIARDYDRLHTQASRLAELGARTRQQATQLNEALRRLGQDMASLDVKGSIAMARQFGEIARNPRRFGS